MTKTEILEMIDAQDSFKIGEDIVIFNSAIKAMQEYADQETAALKVENERLRLLLPEIEQGARAEEKRKAAQRMKDVSEQVEIAIKNLEAGNYFLAKRVLDDANTLLKLPI